jgi:hypothetical protein
MTSIKQHITATLLRVRCYSGYLYNNPDEFRLGSSLPISLNIGRGFFFAEIRESNALTTMCVTSDVNNDAPT